MDKITFYREWLRLPKGEFRIMAMLADREDYTGNLSSLCDYFSLTRQTRNTTALRTAIETLTATGYILCETHGRTYRLRPIPKAEEIEIKREWLHRLIRHDYSSESVSWENVLKVLLWIIQNQEPVITNDLIAKELNISVSAIGYAKNVLEKDYEAITRRKISERTGENTFRTIGQELAASAWWIE